MQSAWRAGHTEQALCLVLQTVGPPRRYHPSVAEPLWQLRAETYGRKWHTINDSIVVQGFLYYQPKDGCGQEAKISKHVHYRTVQT